MFKDDEGARSHAACRAGGGLIELKGVFEGLEKQFEIVFREACVVGKERVDEAVAAVEAVGDGEFAAHGAFLLDVLLIGDGGAGDGMLAGDDGIDGAGEGDLHRAAHLAAIHFRGHDGAEGADVVVVLAHPCGGSVFDFRFHGFGRSFTDSFVGSFVLEVVDGSFGKIDALAVLSAASEGDEVADLALEADIGDESLAGFHVDAGQIACIGIAVGVGVLAVEEEEEVVAVVHRIKSVRFQCSVFREF